MRTLCSVPGTTAKTDFFGAAHYGEAGNERAVTGTRRLVHRLAQTSESLPRRNIFYAEKRTGCCLAVFLARQSTVEGTEAGELSAGCSHGVINSFHLFENRLLYCIGKSDLFVF